MGAEEGAIPGALFARIDSVEHRLRDELSEQRQEQAQRNDHVSQRLSDIGEELAGIRTGVSIGKWLLGGVGAVLLATLAGVISLVMR